MSRPKTILSVETVEPEQKGERRVTLFDPAQPIVIMGFHKPDMYHEDDAVFAAVSDLMGKDPSLRFQAITDWMGLVEGEALDV